MGRHNLKSAKASRQKRRNEKREKKKTNEKLEKKNTSKQHKQCNIKTVKSDTATEKSSNPFTLSTTCSSLDKRGSLSNANTRNCESISTVSKASYTSSDRNFLEQNGENDPLYINYKNI